MGLLILLIFTILGGTIIAVVMLVDFDDTNNEALSESYPDGALEDTPHPTMEPTSFPTFQPTKSAAPTFKPSSFPSMSPTVPPTFQPTKSAAPTSKPSSFPSMSPTVPQMGCRRDRFDNEGNREENNHLFAGSYVCSDDSDHRYMFGIDPDTTNLIWRDSLTGQVKTYYWNEWHRHSLEVLSPTAEPTVLDYFFTLSTKGAFRMWRVRRTEDYQIVRKNLHWELPSLFEIPTVYEDCLLKHDCPYMHLHQDGVMVLAWLDYENSEYFDGWMEENIRRCYTFNTTDSL